MRITVTNFAPYISVDKVHIMDEITRFNADLNDQACAESSDNSILATAISAGQSKGPW